MGLSLAKQAVEQTGGSLKIGTSEELGGAMVEMSFVCSHIDRAPMGDLGSVVAGMVFTCPNINFVVKIFDDQSLLLEIRSGDLRADSKDEFTLSKQIEDSVNACISSLNV